MASDNAIQGKDAVLSFLKEIYLPYVCATNFSIEFTGTTIPDRTSSSGRWDSSEYQTIGYIINLSGVLVFDTDNFDSDEIIKNMIQFSYLKFRVNFTAADGTIKSYQGTCTVDSASLSMAVADVVKGSFKLTGRGEPMRFNGLVPCDSAITDILFSGLSDPSGTVTITYTYTGLPYQVKYRADGAGPYLYALVDQPIVLYGQSVGLHLFEIIPVCSNDYDGTALQKDYTVTKDLSCSAEISDIAISDSYSASNTHTVGVTTMQYRIDGGVWITASIDTPIDVGGLSAGNHTIEEVPICDNGIPGTGFTKNFSISVQPAQSVITYTFSGDTTTSPSFKITVNGIVYVIKSLTSHGVFTVNTGDVVKISVANTRVGAENDIETKKNSVVIDSRTAFSPAIAMYTFTAADGAAYTITASSIF